MFYFYTGTVYYMTEEEIIWFQCNGSFNTENTTLFKYSKYRFWQKCLMWNVFYTLIHIQQRIVLLTNIRTWITYGNCVEIILSVIRNGIQKMTKWDSLELNEKFYPEHVWLFFLYHYHYSSRKHNKLFCFVIYEFNKMSLKKKMILR